MQLKLIGAALRTVARLSPSAGSRIAFDLFRTPRRFRTPEREVALLADAEPLELHVSHSMTIKGWRWGNGPPVILIHGWEGRGSQMATFARPLADAGYTVVTFDAPGHGASSGRRSSLPHFTWALRCVARFAGPVHGIIGHSLGCAAATLAMHDGLEAARAVYFAPPLHPADYTRQFGEIFGLKDEVIEGLRARIEERFLRPWSDYSLADMAPAMSAKLLIIHDRGDDDTPYAGGARLAELWPDAQLITTEGLGHRRILRETSTVDAAVRFLALGS